MPRGLGLGLVHRAYTPYQGALIPSPAEPLSTEHLPTVPWPRGALCGRSLCGRSLCVKPLTTGPLGVGPWPPKALCRESQHGMSLCGEPLCVDLLCILGFLCERSPVSLVAVCSSTVLWAPGSSAAPGQSATAPGAPPAPLGPGFACCFHDVPRSRPWLAF